ncbi:MAG: hypothetical protein AB1899_17630 [Pseudomonadota bacterium]
MTRLTTLLALFLVTLNPPSAVQAAGPVSANCNVVVEYVYGGALVEEYIKDFVVQQGVAYEDDFSTTTRTKVFSAILTKEAGKAVVNIDYFNDVGVFVAIGFNTRLTLRGTGNPESTSGSHTTYISSGVTPTSVGGNHETHYTLVCTRG